MPTAKQSPSPPCPLPEAKPGAGLLDNYLTMMDKKTGVCKKDATQHDSPSPGSLSEYKNHEANTGTAICVLSKSNGTLLSIHNIAFLPNGVDNLYGGLDFKCRHHFRCELLPDFYAHFDAFLVFFRVLPKKIVKISNQLPLIFYILMDILVNLILCFLIFSFRFFTYLVQFFVSPSAAALCLIYKSEPFILKNALFLLSFFKFNTVQKILFSYIRLHFCNKQNWFSCF